MEFYSILRIFGVISAVVGSMLCVLFFHSNIRKITTIGIVCMLLGIAMILSGMLLDDDFRCGGCNEILGARDNFCSNCGQSRDGIIICEKCSDIVDEADNFCSKCGFQIAKQEN